MKTLILFLFSTIAYSATLTPPVTNSLFVAPLNYNGSSILTSKVGNCIIPAPAYHIVQWDNPQQLTGNCTNTTSNSSSRVSYVGNNTWELAQNGALLDCSKEFNLFIEANRFSPLGLQRSSMLSRLSSLNININAQGLYEKIGIKCQTNLSAAIIALVLDNPISKQTLFYQIILRDSRTNIYPNMSWCPFYEKSFNNQFCVDDDIRLYGKPRVSGAKTNYSINILPRLVKIIQSNHTKSGFKLDSNLSNWSVGSVYFGNKINGESLITTRWSNFSLSETPK